MSPKSAESAVEPDEPTKSPARRQSIKRRVVRLVLVPSVVALLLWFTASGYLVFQGFYNRAVAQSVRQVSIPAVAALSSIQQERRLSVAYLARPSRDLNALLSQRSKTDKQVADLRTAAGAALGLAPDSIKSKWQALTTVLDQLPNTRSAVDARSLTAAKAYAFYNTVLDAATDLFDNQARVVPDVTATQGGLTATEVFRASDLMSRAASSMDGAFASGALNQASYLQFVRLVGAYRFALGDAAGHLEPDARKQFDTLQATASWQQLTTVENAIISAGPWHSGVPVSISAGRDKWTNLTDAVSDDLINVTVTQADRVSAKALDTGNNQLLTALLGSLVALAVAIGAIVWAVRQSRVLVDRALSVRLARLGTDAGELVDRRLPAVMDRLRHREPVDLITEFATADYGGDEIGRVAEVINRSLLVAAGAAVDEAKARAAGTAMLMGVARRPQRPLQRGLKVVEDLQNRIGDEQLLVELFDIHHQLNQTRRFLENLVILAGGQIGRHFKNPVTLRRVLLASFAEARNYQRITLRGAADVALAGHAVAEVIHLTAELLDNALAFSPPASTVWVTANQVNHGVAIEIEDAGVGMSADAVEQANTLLATAPTPDVTELKDGAQVGLYVVAELAKREGLQVSLRRSAYGGLLAIVLLPERLLVASTEPPESGTAPARMAPSAETRHEPERPAMPGIVPTASRSAVGLLEPEPERLPGPGPQRVPETPGGAVTTPSRPERPPLPHRRPQQHLVPELREDGADQGAPPPARSPDEARNRFARYQQGRNEGRVAGRDEQQTYGEQGGNA
ncbi:sensor histidine kinase [Actinoplanes subtropicus]|uniref:sensor histidine kinase n=1 Tax=Actinoplanes subtropicus TaxID=543632 RepID=UPI000689BF99|nr:nitrate- and nitrite sensing domain-containing protein [Actinoplanes subtropicus]